MDNVVQSSASEYHRSCKIAVNVKYTAIELNSTAFEYNYQSVSNKQAIVKSQSDACLQGLPPSSRIIVQITLE